MKIVIAAGLLSLGHCRHSPSRTRRADGGRGRRGKRGGDHRTAQGLRRDVRVARIGNAPLDECIVTNVRTLSRPAQIIPIDDDDITVFTTFPKPKVTVTLNCYAEGAASGSIFL